MATVNSPLDPENAQIEPDVDNDSALGEEDEESTASLSTSNLNFVWEHGRRYHAYNAGQYLYPNDETELDREDVKHHALKLLINGELQATKFESSPLKVLDVGTGTGIWAMEFADEHPASQVIGVDLSPVQPHFVPPNLVYQVDNIESQWTYGQQVFDYIHVRSMANAIRNWPVFLKSCNK